MNFKFKSAVRKCNLTVSCFFCGNKRVVYSTNLSEPHTNINKRTSFPKQLRSGEVVLRI